MVVYVVLADILVYISETLVFLKYTEENSGIVVLWRQDAEADLGLLQHPRWSALWL